MEDKEKKKSGIHNNEDGYILILSLIILLMLTVIGISSQSTTSIEIQIAGNDRSHKMAFYAADGGTEGGIEVLEQNIDIGGFAATDDLDPVIIDGASLSFYTNTEGTDTENTPSATNWDVQIPNLGEYTAYIKIYGNTQLSTGSALQLAAGYEGKGKGVAGGGGYVAYEVRSFSEGPANTQSRVMHRWRHLL